ncbi:unnamed protein product [Larinioides sclopetarius]|uniref:Uncharacterized protein n=1 Tax=Larinioides sclopetarius TaxID=280406 RepID=A0AAV2BAI8_9ARAC
MAAKPIQLFAIGKFVIQQKLEMKKDKKAADGGQNRKKACQQIVKSKQKGPRIKAGKTTKAGKKKKQEVTKTGKTKESKDKCTAYFSVELSDKDLRSILKNCSDKIILNMPSKKQERIAQIQCKIAGYETKKKKILKIVSQTGEKKEEISRTSDTLQKLKEKNIEKPIIEGVNNNIQNVPPFMDLSSNEQAYKNSEDLQHEVNSSASRIQHGNCSDCNNNKYEFKFRAPIYHYADFLSSYSETEASPHSSSESILSRSSYLMTSSRADSEYDENIQHPSSVCDKIRLAADDNNICGEYSTNDVLEDLEQTDAKSSLESILSALSLDEEKSVDSDSKRSSESERPQRKMENKAFENGSLYWLRQWRLTQKNDFEAGETIPTRNSRNRDCNYDSLTSSRSYQKGR